MHIQWHRESEPKLTVNKKGEVVYFTYPSIDQTEGILHGFTSRSGGVSKGIYSSMNLSFTRGDEEEAVRENFRRIAEAIGFSVENIVMSDQTHTANIRKVTEEDRGKGFTRPRDYTDVDGLITDVPGLVLSTFYADCVPLFFVDPVNMAVGLSHSGWRGTVQKIGKATIKAMQEAYGTKPEDIIAGIGPSICRDCYEVSRDVIEEFEKVFDEKWWGELYWEKPDEKYQLDLWRANQLILQEEGVSPENIFLPNLCTCCNPDLLFSHRASQGKRGNLAAFLGIV